MNSLAVFQYEEIKTAVVATTMTGNFSLTWPEPIMKDVTRELDIHDGFLIDENSFRVSWRNPAYPTREVPSLLSADRAFISSIITILEKIQTTKRERYSNDSYYTYITAKPNLPSSTLQFLHTFYLDGVRISRSNSSKTKTTYFVKWTNDFSIDDKYKLYILLASQYRDLFIHIL